MRDYETITRHFIRAPGAELGKTTAATDAEAALVSWWRAGAGAWRYEIQSESAAGLVALLEFDAESYARGMAVLAGWCEEFGIEPAPLH